jgi:hypothetical protein
LWPRGGFGTRTIDGGGVRAARLSSGRGVPVAIALAAFTAAASAAPAAASAALPPVGAITAISAWALTALDSCLALGAHWLAVAGRCLGPGCLIIARTIVATRSVSTGRLGTGGLVGTRALAAPGTRLSRRPRPAVASRVAATLAADIPVSISISAAISIAVALTAAKAAGLAVRGRGSIPVGVRGRRFGSGSGRPARAE